MKVGDRRIRPAWCLTEETWGVKLAADEFRNSEMDINMDSGTSEHVVNRMEYLS